MEELFRPEAVSHAAKRLEGRVMVGARLPWTVLGYSLFGGLACAILVMATITYPTIERVSGHVVEAERLIKIQSVTSGEICRLRVNSGSFVRRGDLLATVCHTRDDASNALSGAQFNFTSPVTGVVESVSVYAGESIGPGLVISQVRPIDPTFNVELYIPIEDIQYITLGEDVPLRLEGFEASPNAPIVGRIENISKSITLSSAMSPGAARTAPQLKITLAVDRSYLQAYGTSFPLQPNMLVSANLPLSRRTALARFWTFITKHGKSM